MESWNVIVWIKMEEEYDWRVQMARKKSNERYDYGC